ncbi:MAG: hypothetical protein HKN07_03840 [Acidimicrobiia bacterium]|nr:hypothetical protein [Acidimicrobiia bacterium]
MNDALITFLPAADLDRASRFYGDTLGLELVVDQGMCRIYRVATSGFIGLCQRDEATIDTEGVIVTIVRDDVDEFCARLVAKGVTLEQPPNQNEQFGIYQAFLRDPDGNLVEVQRFDDPDWAGA